MRFRVLATDYDGTLARHGEVDPDTAAAMRRFVQSGRHLVLVTGRLLHEVRRICAGAELFEYIVAEDGAVVWSPQWGIQIQAQPVALDLVAELRRRGVTPLNVGRVICSTWEDHEADVAECIAELGLEVHLSHNKGSLMVIPNNVNKGLGLRAALTQMQERPSAVVAVGDAENDIALLKAGGVAVAVANALPEVKRNADIILERSHGAGVTELMNAMMEDDLEGLLPANSAPQAG